MPELDILDKDGSLRWDAPGRLEATIYFPDRIDFLLQYEARWRAEHKHLLPSRKRLNEKTTHGPARTFGARSTMVMKNELRKRREQIERIGTALWLQAVLNEVARPDASENKVAFWLASFADGGSTHTSRATLKRDLTRYRGVIHWCAAMSYQRRVFGSPLRRHPDLGPPKYTIYAALFDFLELGDQFYGFACDSGTFAEAGRFKPERDLWTLPEGVKSLAPRRDKAWPDCNRVRADVLPSVALLDRLEHYDATLFRA
jgi:hypothetical protein